MKDFVGDSSFYLCFLDDVSRIVELRMTLDAFKHHLGNTVWQEISKSKAFPKIKDHSNLNVFSSTKIQLGELLKPFFSRDECVKGEHEVIVIAYVLYEINKNIIIVIDEANPREFLINNYPHLKPFLCGTIGFLGDCVTVHGIFKKETVLELFDLMERSKFRASSSIYTTVRKKLQN